MPLTAAEGCAPGSKSKSLLLLALLPVADATEDDATEDDGLSNAAGAAAGASGGLGAVDAAVVARGVVAPLPLLTGTAGADAAAAGTGTGVLIPPNR